MEKELFKEIIFKKMWLKSDFYSLPFNFYKSCIKEVCDDLGEKTIDNINEISSFYVVFPFSEQEIYNKINLEFVFEMKNAEKLSYDSKIFEFEIYDLKDEKFNEFKRIFYLYDFMELYDDLIYFFKGTHGDVRFINKNAEQLDFNDLMECVIEEKGEYLGENFRDVLFKGLYLLEKYF